MPCLTVLGSSDLPGLMSLALLLPSITVICSMGIKAPFSLEGAVLQWFMNALFAQTSDRHYSESLRAFFHNMSLTSALNP